MFKPKVDVKTPKATNTNILIVKSNKGAVADLKVKPKSALPTRQEITPKEEEVQEDIMFEIY